MNTINHRYLDKDRKKRRNAEESDYLSSVRWYVKMVGISKMI